MNDVSYKQINGIIQVFCVNEQVEVWIKVSQPSYPTAFIYNANTLEALSLAAEKGKYIVSQVWWTVVNNKHYKDDKFWIKITNKFSNNLKRLLIILLIFHFMGDHECLYNEFPLGIKS